MPGSPRARARRRESLPLRLLAHVDLRIGVVLGPVDLEIALDLHGRLAEAARLLRQVAALRLLHRGELGVLLAAFPAQLVGMDPGVVAVAVAAAHHRPFRNAGAGPAA